MGEKQNTKPICEILAPAGSFACMKAAFLAGADAVYAGGSMFGARASAVNFTNEELLQAIDYAHIHQKKLYLTVNTLLKENEIETLEAYLTPFYQAGLDAVIVQDFGVLKWIRAHFPDLSIHASTQMNVTGTYFAQELKRLGVTRIVTARELSLEEVSRIATETGLEIESFVHGALCYSYSGQCLLSSMIGGRSGNRGRCAQPCRLEYVVKGSGNEKGYLLSPKDLCTLTLIPELIAAGIYSFKIEGRMKKPEYVASVTSMYRKYVDAYLEKGKEGFQVEKEDIRLLQEIYNRGGFTDGYYHRHNGKEMMSMKKPGHQGVCIGKICQLTKEKIEIEALLDLKKGDVLEFDLKKGSPNYTCGTDLKAGTHFTIRNKFQNGFTIRREGILSMEVHRMRNQSLIDALSENYINEELKTGVTGRIELREACEASLTISDGNCEVTLFGPVVQKAQKQPLTRESIEEKMRKTGDTGFYFESLQIVCEDEIFLPVRELNQLRREAFAALEEKICAQYRREKRKENIPESEERCREIARMSCVEGSVQVLVSSIEQFEEAICHAVVTDVIVEASLFSTEEISGMLVAANEKKKGIYLALPYIFRKGAYGRVEERENLYFSKAVKGYLFRNPEAYFYFCEWQEKLQDKIKMFDSMIYAYNKEAEAYLMQYVDCLTMPRECNASELEILGTDGKVQDVYGRFPVMITAGCVKKNLSGCTGEASLVELTDRKGDGLKVLSVCRECYNVIYQEEPLCLFEELPGMHCGTGRSYRLHFTFEKRGEVTEILTAFEQSLYKHALGARGFGNTGHYRRGVL